MSVEYAVYVAETPLKPREGHPPPPEGVMHVFMALARPDPEGEGWPCIDKEMHFVGRDGRLTAIFGISASRAYLDPEQTIQQVCSGSGDSVRPVWDRACAIANALSSLGLPFSPLSVDDPRAVNCRAGVRTVLQAMGEPTEALERDPEARGAKALLLDFVPEELRC